MHFRRIISLALAATVFSSSIARAKELNTPEGPINTGGSMQSHGQAVVERNPELELRITNIQSRLIAVLDNKSNVADATWSKGFVTDRTPSKYAPTAGESRVNYVLSYVSETGLSSPQQEQITNACKRIQSGSTNDQDYVIVHLANVLIQLVKDNGVLPDEDRYNKALAAVKDTVTATTIPSKTTLERASVLDSEISEVVLGKKTTSAQTIDLLLGQLKEIKDRDAKSKLLPYLQKAYDNLHQYGFGNYVPGTDASGQPVVTYESLLDALIIAWNEAKAFRMQVQELFIRSDQNQLVNFLGSVEEKKAPIVISLLNNYLYGMKIVSELEFLPNNKPKAVEKLKELAKSLNAEASAGQSQWSEYQEEFRTIFYPKLSSIEQTYFDSLSVLPFFSAVVFHRAYQKLNEQTEGLLTRDAKFAIFSSAIKLHALSQDPRVLNFYFMYALPAIAERCGGSREIFEQAVLHVDYKLSRIIDPEKMHSTPFLDRTIFALRLSEAFYRFSDIPLNILSKQDRTDTLNTYVQQERLSHQFSLRPLGFMPADSEFFNPFNPQLRVPRNFDYANPNQKVFDMVGGFTSESSISPVNVRLLRPESFAEQEVGAARASLDSGLLPSQLSVYPQGSLMTGYSPDSLMRAIDLAFLPKSEPQYSGKVVGGGLTGGAEFGDEVETIWGGVGAVLFLQGGIGVSGFSQNYSSSSSRGFTGTAAQIPLPLAKKDTGLFFNIHDAGVSLSERKSGSDQSGLTAKQKQWLVEWYSSVATKRDANGNLIEPGEFLVKVWSLDDAYPVAEGTTGPTGNKRLKVDTVYVGRDGQVYLYYGQDDLVPPYNNAGGVVSIDPVTFGITMVTPGREPFFDENMLMQFPEYKKELTTLRQKYPNWNNKDEAYKQERENYEKEHSALVDKYKEEIAVNGGGVFAVDLPNGWAAAAMYSSVAGPAGERNSHQYVGAAAKTWQEPVISPWNKGTATLIIGAPGMVLDPESQNARPVQTVHIAWREVGGPDRTKNGIPEAWQVDLMGGGMETPNERASFVGGLQVRYQNPGATRRVGVAVSYSRADAYYQRLLAVNPGSESTTVSSEKSEGEETQDAKQLVSDYEDKLRYLHRFYARAYYADQLGTVMIGLLGSMLVEWKDKLEDATSENDKKQIYWNIVATLAAVNKVFGLQLYTRRSSSGQMALSELKSAISRVAANPSLMESVLTPQLESDFDVFFQEYGLRVQVLERGSLDFSIISKENKEDQYKPDGIERVRGRAVWNFDEGFVRVAGEYPIGTGKDSERIGWYSIGGGAVFHPGPWFHRFAADLLFIPTSASAEDSFKPRGGQLTLAAYEDAAYQWYLICSMIFPDWKEDRAKIDVGTMVEISNKGKFYLIYDQTAGNIFVTTDDKEAKKRSLIAGTSVTLYKRGNVEVNLDSIISVPLKESPMPATSSTLSVRAGQWSFMLGGSLMSKDAYTLSPMDTWRFSPANPYMQGGRWAASIGFVLTYSFGVSGGSLAPSVSAPYMPTPLERGGTGRSPFE